MLPAATIGFANLPGNRLSKWSRACALMLLGLLIIQFLPIHINDKLPAMQGAAPTYDFWTSTPSRSLASALFAYCVLGFFLFVATFADRQQKMLFNFIVSGFVINFIVGIIQLSYGNQIAIVDILPYPIASGMFANQNHFSSLAYVMIPLFAWRFLSASWNPLIFAIIILLIVIFLFAVGSRAGMMISIGLAGLSYIWMLKKSLPRHAKLALSGAIMIGFLVGTFYVRSAILFDDDTRAIVFTNTWRAINDHWLGGTGLGSFVLIYPMYELSEQILPVYINHTHNEYLELLLEVGILAIPVLLLFFILIVKNLFNSPMGEAASLSLFSILVHSSVDYPLRTMAIAILFATFCAIILSRPIKRSKRVRRSKKHNKGVQPALPYQSSA